ncbi:hypothetical protein N9152_00780 [bacterium]|nr:hypothetical protein [bacterium]
MTNYTKTTDFAAKDSLPSGDSGKIIRGTEFETEFDNIATAVNSKSDANNPTFTGTVTIDGLTVNGNTVLGNAATDTVTVTADIASNLLPSADDTYNLGAVGAEWNDLFIDGVANIDSLVADTADINGGTVDGVTSVSFSSGNLTLPDNSKAIFGAGSDLQIFHDGDNSRILDQGTGSLIVRSNQLQIQSPAGETLANFNQDSDVQLRYNNAQKLATTSTGIDVSGTVTADGLDASTGDITTASIGFNGSRTTTPDGLSYPIIWRSASAHPDFNSGDLVIQARSDADRDIHFVTGNTPTERMKIASNGDVSLFEDTGTTPKFFWDSSAEQLKIGTIEGAAGGSFVAKTDSNGYALAIEENSGTERWSLGVDVDGDLGFFNSTDTTASVTFDDSGNVGIGTSSPNQNLDVDGNVHLASGGGSLLVGASGAAIIDLERPTANYIRANNSGTANLVLGTGADLRFCTGQADGDFAQNEAMRIDASGNVGINTSSPQGPLQVALNSSRNLVVGFDTEGDSRVSLRSIEDVANNLRPIQVEGSEIVLGTAAFDQTVSSEAMRIDSSGNVGIGISSPSQKLHVYDNTVVTSSSNIDIATFQSQTANVGGTNFKSGIRLQHSADTDKAVRITAIQATDYSNSMHMGFEVSNSSATPPYEAMRIGSTGRVGIGLTSNTSSSSQLQVLGSGITVSDSVTALGTKNCRYFGVSQADQEATMMYLSASASSNTLILGGGTSIAEPASVIKFHTGAIGTKSAGVEAMRITSSGTVLVGKTSSTSSTVGAELRQNGLIIATTSSVPSLTLNRTTSDGTIAEFRKDNTTVVGTISAASTNIIYGNDTRGLKIEDALIIPRNVNDTNANGQMDLGSNSSRFKDLYLSGGAYLGGIASANKLDDFEEGTWSPVYEPETGSFTTMTMDNVSNTYTKIGDTVIAMCYVRTSDVDVTGASGDVYLGGLPFTINGYFEVSIGNVFGWAGERPDGGFGFTGQDYVKLRYRSSVTSDSADSDVSDLTTGTTANRNQIIMTFIYKTSA